VPKPHPDHDASRENLTRLSNDLDSLDELVRGLSKRHHPPRGRGDESNASDRHHEGPASPRILATSRPASARRAKSVKRRYRPRRNADSNCSPRRVGPQPIPLRRHRLDPSTITIIPLSWESELLSRVLL
jgi:hypothetical protein